MSTSMKKVAFFAQLLVTAHEHALLRLCVATHLVFYDGDELKLLLGAGGVLQFACQILQAGAVGQTHALGIRRTRT